MTEPSPSIFIIEDEEDIRDLLIYNLEKRGFRVESSTSGEEGLKRVRSRLPDLVLLDLMLPKLSGYDVCRILKADADTAPVPIIMVTAKGEEDDIVKGLELGADDYITKPFQLKEVVARIQTVLRRNLQGFKSDPKLERVDRPPFTWYPNKAEIHINNTLLDLSHSEYKIMELMLSKPGWVFTRGQIMDHIKGDNSRSTQRAIDVIIVGLRKKLKAPGADIETVRGIGYRLRAHE